MRISDEYGWHGDLSETWNYESLPKMIRSTLRDRFPECKWSVRRLSGRGTPVLRVRLLEAPDVPVYEWAAPYAYGVMPVNQRDLDTDNEDNRRLKPWAREMFEIVNDYLDSLNYDHSDVMRDYFDVGFYTETGIGDDEKPFIQKAGKRK